MTAYDASELTFKVRGNWSDRSVACRVAMCLGTSGPLAWEDGDKGYPHWRPEHATRPRFSDSDTSVVVMDKDGKVIKTVATSVTKASAVSDQLRCEHREDTVCIVPPEGKWDVGGNEYWLRRIDQGPPDEISEEHVLRWPVRTFKLNYRYATADRVEALKALCKWLECDLVFGT